MDFIEENKTTFIEWLQKIDDYPQVCYYASQVLGVYMAQKYNCNVEICAGCFKSIKRLAHMWLELTESGVTYTIDFTYGQFDANEPYLIEQKTEKLSKQGNVLFDEEIYIYYNNSISFEDYLQKVAQNISFDKYTHEMKQGYKNKLFECK